MTTTIVSASLAALLLAAGATTGDPLPTTKTFPKTTVKVDPKLASKLLPKFAPLLSKTALVKGAKDSKVVPTSSDPPLTTLATLSATHSREGNYALDFRCANVNTSADGDGMVLWPHRLIEYCRDQMDDGYEAGVDVVFPAEAGKAYAVECNSQAGPRWRIRHQIGGSAWSAEITTTTSNPADYVLATTTGQARVRLVVDPTTNHVLQQGIRFCRVSRLG